MQMTKRGHTIYLDEDLQKRIDEYRNSLALKPSFTILVQTALKAFIDGNK